MKLKMPYGISKYEKIVNDGYYYVDKTMYIEKLENLPETSIIFLRPRKFGKTLFTSVLENYYDKNKADKFESLYGNTYIGKNPTKLKNTYCILRFNFSGINTENEETTMRGFKEKVSIFIDSFAKKYGIDFYVNIEPENTLVIFDEVQETQKALTALKYFCENANQYNIVVAGLFLGVTMHEGISFPVEKVDFLDLYPLK